MEESIYLFKVILSCLLGVQNVSVFLFLIIEWAIVDYYKLGTFENPDTIFDNFTNFFMKLFFGSGYYLYRKFQKHNWFIRKLLMLIAWVLHGILCIIIFYLVTLPLDLIFK
jgi:hypothetical protein